ncbi:hypothetical protein NQZ68_034794 [Dissostichus eleginoides]|nr:hypothetical protein NQZ68_034794 [Dissostichus eleginoides]
METSKTSASCRDHTLRQHASAPQHMCPKKPLLYVASKEDMGAGKGQAEEARPTVTRGKTSAKKRPLNPSIRPKSSCFPLSALVPAGSEKQCVVVSGWAEAGQLRFESDCAPQLKLRQTCNHSKQLEVNGNELLDMRTESWRGRGYANESRGVNRCSGSRERCEDTCCAEKSQ